MFNPICHKNDNLMLENTTTKKIFHLNISPLPKKKIISHQFSHTETMEPYMALHCKEKIIIASCWEKMVWEISLTANITIFSYNKQVSKGLEKCLLLKLLWSSEKISTDVYTVCFKNIFKSYKMLTPQYNSFYRNTVHIID